MWLITITYTGGQGALAILTAALSFATFTIIVGLGQMMVITTGPGNVDLSIPATITLSGVVAMKVMDEQSGGILLGIVAALGAAGLVGIFNYAPDPPAAHSADHRHPVVELPHPLDGHFLWPRHPHQAAASPWRTSPRRASSAFRSWPSCVLAISIVMALVLKRTLYGRSVLAIGQNMRAAWLAGLNVDRTRFVTYVLSAFLAGVCGILLSGFSRRGRAQHGRGIPARLHRGGGHRRNLGGRRPRQCAGHLGCGALHVSAGHHAQHASAPAPASA